FMILEIQSMIVSHQLDTYTLDLQVISSVDQIVLQVYDSETDEEIGTITEWKNEESDSYSYEWDLAVEVEGSYQSLDDGEYKLVA
ncbi:hypothetical protein, partial [Halalkalibacter lacteus]|uniref:hypothetical protein n=1 Tax=Halalkalibacter lacteus TaxID=3090663 RepID=UPI002FC96463